MSRAVAVIGAGWGDEGKGLLVDALATADHIVVRGNGGAQAGHSVARPDGGRHVFHHVGSGALRGAATYLSRFFLHNPMLLHQELPELAALGVRPRLLADPAGLVTTPWDMMLNQMAEEARRDKRHGSCGLGILETLRRGDSALRLTLAACTDPARLAAQVAAIQTEWVPARLAELGLNPSPVWRTRLTAPAIRARFLDDVAAMLALVTFDDGARVAAAARRGLVIFEGAQGLLLDRDHAFFPHVTPSKTGLANPSLLAAEWGIADLDAVYVSRAYATRHGAGPFPREIPGLAYADPTNVPNMWQGTLRFGALDLDLLRDTIAADAPHAVVNVNRHLALTCLDQIGDGAVWWRDGQRHSGGPQALVAAAEAHLALPLAATSAGPCRETVRWWKSLTAEALEPARI